MSVKITFEYICDICKGQIRANEHYETMPFVPAQNMNWATPSVGADCVGQSHVCQQCMFVARVALIKLIHKIRPDHDIIADDIERVRQRARQSFHSGINDDRVETWMYTEKLTPFGSRTAADLIAEGRADDVIKYLDLVECGNGG